MEREEAIQILADLIDSPFLHTWEKQNKALHMAIEALSKPNYESDTEVRLAVTDRNKDKVILLDPFGELDYYPHGEINCVYCPHYYETEDDTGVHSHCGGGDAEMNEVKSPYMQQTTNGATHGRLIDADALIAKINKTVSDIARAEQDNYGISLHSGNIMATYSDLIRLVMDAPTVQADRPHGEWIEREDWNGDSYYDCSVCGESFVLCDGTPSMNLYHFCPNCGARMFRKDEK